ncbi:MAG TPA: hypothetical protein PK771_15575 [Spirochaetota bacterium]|nr:hypothetical protein [Spirochaetota bacterium]
MKKTFFFIFYFFILFFTFAQEVKEKIVIGIAPPLIRNKNVTTIFMNRQFIFEFLSLFPDNIYDVEILTPKVSENENEYLNNSFNEGFKIEVDYIAVSKVYIVNNKIFFEFNIINPYNNIVYFSSLYSKTMTENMNDFLLEITDKIIKSINQLKLEKIKNKNSNIKKKNIDNVDKIVEDKTFYKHEVFILNAFLKNTPKIMSFLSWYIGYNFTPFNFFNVETGLFLGTGFKENEFSFDKIGINDFFVGGFGSVGFFIPGIIQPSINLRLEFGYIVNDIAFFSLPVDLGIKIFVTKENVIRINSSFQFNYLSFNSLLWEKNYIIGIMVGYARKI